MRRDSSSYVKLGLSSLRFFISGCLVMVAASLAQADPSPRLVKNVGAWGLYCADHIVESDDCAIAQETVDKVTKRSVKITFAFQDTGQLRLRIATGPVFRNRNIAVFIDGEQSSLIEAQNCNKERCVAYSLLARSFVDRLNSSEELGFEAQSSPEGGELAIIKSSGLEEAFVQLHSEVVRFVKLGPDDIFSDTAPAPSTKRAVAPVQVAVRQSVDMGVKQPNRSVQSALPASINVSSVRSICARKGVKHQVPVFLASAGNTASAISVESWSDTANLASLEICDNTFDAPDPSATVVKASAVMKVRPLSRHAQVLPMVVRHNNHGYAARKAALAVRR